MTFFAVVALVILTIIGAAFTLAADQNILDEGDENNYN